MRHYIRIALTTFAAGVAIAVVLAAAVPVWLLLRVPGSITPPAPETF